MYAAAAVEVFDARMEQLCNWLQRRPESCIAVVSHWGCLQALTGGPCPERTAHYIEKLVDLESNEVTESKVTESETCTCIFACWCSRMKFNVQQQQSSC